MADIVMKETEPDQAFVQKGQHILIRMPSGNVKMVGLKPKTQISLGKFGSFLADNLIGQPFGLSYEIYTNKGDIRPVSHAGVNTAVEETAANNQMIIDDSSVQKLSHEQVLALKEQGLQGTMAAEEIIKKMVDSHGGFDKKTEYSKAKYIERKKKKFNKIFIPIRPTLRTMCEYFFTKNPDKIKHLRIDTLSQLLSMANIHSNSKVLVVDDTQGMIVTSILERMGGLGTVVGVHEGDHHNYDVIRYMNFPQNVLGTLHTVPFDMVDPETPNDPFDIKTEQEIKEMSEDSRRNYIRRKKAFDIRATARRLLFEGDFDGLVISSACTPDSIIKELSKYLCGSRPIVVYSYSKEQLLNTAYWMRKSTDYLNAEVNESSLRQYQVLPGRMHPNMMMSAGGGFLLSALRVIDCPFDISLVTRDESSRRTKKKKTQKDSNEEEKKQEEN